MFTTAREAGLELIQLWYSYALEYPRGGTQRRSAQHGIRSLDSALITRYTNDICELLLFLKCRDAVKKHSAPKEWVAEGDYDSYLGSVTTVAESTRSGAYLADN